MMTFFSRLAVRSPIRHSTVHSPIRRSLALPSIAVAAALGLSTIWSAQAAVSGVDAVAVQLRNERAALARAQQQARSAEARASQMSAQAEDVADAAERDRIALAALGQRIQAAEADLAAVRSEMRILANLQGQQRAKLAAQQRPVLELMASLQLLSRRPPLSLLAQPGAARDMVHSRAMIGAVMPDIRRRTAGLRAEIARSQRLELARQHAATALVAGTRRLDLRRRDLAHSAAQQRIRAASLASDAGLQSDRAMALGEDARDISDLLGQLEVAGTLRDQLASLAGPVARPGTVGESDSHPQVGEIAYEQPAYQLPVIGYVVQGLGELSSEGTRSRGLTIATEPGAQIVAPAAGHVVYAGNFRSYGRIIIIDHGGGWTSLIANMISVSARVGESVAQGAPIGRAGPSRPRIMVELRRAGQPIDIATLAS